MITEFIQFSDSGTSEAPTTPRSILYDSFDVATSAALASATPLRCWPTGASLVQRTRGPLEDMPWCMPGGAPVVSDRLREMFERKAPGAAEYLPVVISGRKCDAPYGPYWVMHVLRDIDCMDRKRSRFAEVRDGERVYYEYDFGGLVIDTDRIPGDVIICRVAHVPETLLMRASCRAACDGSGITGIQYEPIAQV